MKGTIAHYEEARAAQKTKHKLMLKVARDCDRHRENGTEDDAAINPCKDPNMSSTRALNDTFDDADKYSDDADRACTK